VLTTPLYAFVRPAFAEWQYQRRSFPSADRFGAAERTRLSSALIDYLRHRVTYEEMAALRTDAGDIAMRPSELSHMADVRRVMDGLCRAQAIALVLLVAGGVALACTGHHQVFSRGVRRGIELTGALCVVILVAATVDFDSFFTTFHQLFFRNGTWLFSWDDTLIQLYPLPFWITAVIGYVVAMVIEAALLWGVTLLVERQARPTV